MSDDIRIKVLVVDDLQEKLLVYRTILDASDLDVVTARSGAEALKEVLASDFAVILLDVNMPVMDGYETADLIRRRKRSSHTPIIFVTAYADELHTLKGYSYGAVDYILSPVVPEVLRTKVRVFTDLYRLNQQVREQAAREVAKSEKERSWLSAVLHHASDVYLRADADGRISEINPAGRRLLGGQDGSNWPVALTDLGVEDATRAIAAREGAWFGDATLSDIESTAIPVSQLLIAHLDGHHRVESYSLIARDIRERKRVEESNRQLAAIVEGSDDAIIGMTLEGVITSWNPGAVRLYGYAPDEALGQPVLMLVPAERSAEEQTILDEIRHGRRVPHFETVRVTKNGRRIEVSLTISPVFDASGRVSGASKVSQDITERKQTEAELHKYREQLEDLVQERTQALQASHERLRLSDRLASIGTLAAGLGHDMGNLLLPIRARLASMEALDLPFAASDHLNSIKTAVEYLKRLSQGLRWFALDPSESTRGQTTDLRSWWQDVEPFMRNALPKSTLINAEIPVDMPSLDMAPHTFTQVIYNLVQNAGQCLQRASQGFVRLKASRHEDGNRMIVCVTDNGHGMTDEVRDRCLEPFYTTRTRGISTGLGLALVHGAVTSAHGTIEIESQVGVGTTFKLVIPLARRLDMSSSPRLVPGTAYVDIKNARLAAYVRLLLNELGLTTEPHISPSTKLLVIDDRSFAMNDLKVAMSFNSQCHAIVLGQTSIAHQVTTIHEPFSPSKIRAALMDALLKTSLSEEALI